MDPTDPAVDALQVLKPLKESAVRREGVGTNLPIIVVLMREGVDLISFQLYKTVGRTYARALSTAISLTDCDTAVVGSDSFVLTDSDEAERIVETGEPINLAQRFAAGDPDVTEALVVVAVDRDDLMHSAMATYTYDGRTVIWTGDSVETTYEVEGALRNAIDVGFGLQQRRTGKPLAAHELADRLGLAVAVPTLQAPRRNSRCGCGSGKKAKQCCWSPDTLKVGNP